MSALIGLAALSGCAADVVAVEYLSVINIAPPHGAIGVGPETAAAATFSSELDPDSLEDAVWLGDGGGYVFPVTVSYDPVTFTVHIRPQGLLQDATTYTLWLETGIESPEVGPLLAPITSSFTTADEENQPPEALIAEPEGACVRGEPLLLDGASSSDPEGRPLRYRWSLEQGPSGAELSPAGAPEATLYAAQRGEHLIRLAVSDGELESDAAYLLVECE